MANEKRLIWSDEVENKVCCGCNKEFSEEHCEPPECYILAAIAECKTVDAVEVVHGKWHERRFICMDSEVMLGYRCSKCMLTFDAETNYCPNCGAKMDGGNEDG